MEHAITESRARLDRLEQHLRQENPTLLEAVREFRALDAIVHAMGVVPPEESLATQVPWFPVVSILGTFSAGKSSFVNHYLGIDLQRTGNQAVDDKFTVICYAADGVQRTLPGAALDADPRFPFFRISEEIERVAPGEGQRIDAYLQLKTCGSELLRGKILIDSPGFDADAQRTSILRLVDHIIHLSDLVLVFFDARHPEPGAMRDTLDHLVAATRQRADSAKFLYILNQIDTTAREDNPEEVFAAWQRGMAEHGLTAGRFYAIYNPDVAVTIDEPEQRTRYEQKRDADLEEIKERIQQVEVSRAYRIVDALENTAVRVRDVLVPRLERALDRWRRLVWTFDAVLLLVLIGVVGWLIARDGVDVWAERWRAFPGTDFGLGEGTLNLLKIAVLALVLGFVHTRLKILATGLVRGRLEAEPLEGTVPLQIGRAFLRSAGPWRPTWSTRPKGWSRRAERELHRILTRTTELIQKLNDRFTSPSGRSPHDGEPRPESPQSPDVTPESGVRLASVRDAGVRDTGTRDVPAPADRTRDV